MAGFDFSRLADGLFEANAARRSSCCALERYGLKGWLPVVCPAISDTVVRLVPERRGRSNAIDVGQICLAQMRLWTVEQKETKTWSSCPRRAVVGVLASPAARQRRFEFEMMQL
jgi:hypothetical protein